MSWPTDFRCEVQQSLPEDPVVSVVIPTNNDVDLWIRISESHRFEYVPDHLARVNPGHSRLSHDDARAVQDCQRFLAKYKRILTPRFKARLLAKMGAGYSHMGESRKAKRAFMKALRLQPKSTQCYVYLASTFLPKGMYRTIRAWNQRYRASHATEMNV